MADEEVGAEDVALDDAAGGGKKKKKGLGGILPKILMWCGIGVGAIILIVTVVVITMKIMNKNNNAGVGVATAQEYTTKRETLSWYQSIGTIKTKTSDEVSASVVVEVVLGYKLDDKATSTEITQRQIEIKDFLRKYFTSKTIEELRPQNEPKLQMEIRNSINDDILSSSRIKEVKFLTLDVIEQ
ncbi:MAG: flagellar basal body-associated FliL family protein [Treponemataceae bacterium]|nr:flagellar basal body-associated FliL family protein [Treponemataceae bacterium]